MNITAWFIHINEVFSDTDVQRHYNLIEAVETCNNRIRFELPEELLQKASEYGRTEIVTRILEAFPRLKNTVVVNYATIEAARNGHLGTLDLLLTQIKIDTVCQTALSEAAVRGHSACVERLIPMADPHFNDSESFRWAAIKNRLACVKLLLPHSDPCARRGEALQYACAHRNTGMIELLYPLYSRVHVKDALACMQHSVGEAFNQDDADFLEQMYTNSVLSVAVNNQTTCMKTTLKKI